MSEPRSAEERIAELDKKIEQIKAQKKAILQREKQAERKARTKRLIEVGAIIESTLGIEFDNPAKKEKLQQLLIQERPTRNGGTYSYAAFFRSQIDPDQKKP